MVADFGDEASLMAWATRGAERRLLPLLSERSERLGCSAETRNACTDAMVESWALNERLLLAARPVLATLREADIDVMCLKGLALVGDVYPQHRLRPLGDLDIMVRPAHARRAFRLLRAAGWRAPIGSRLALRGNAAINLEVVRGPSIDLHWRPARDLPHRAMRTPPCWSRVEPLPSTHPFAELGLVRPSGEDHLVVMAAHILRASNDHLVHPIADVHHLLNAGATGAIRALDSAAILRIARDELASCRTAAVVEWCAKSLGTPTPEGLDALRRVSEREVRAEERVIDANRRATAEGTGVAETLTHAFYGVRAATGGQGPLAKAEVLISSLASWSDLRIGQWQERRRVSRGVRR